MQVAQFFVAADGIHVGVQPLAGRKSVLVQRHPFPLGQRMDDLCRPAGLGNIEGYRPLHTVQVIVETGGGIDKEGGRHPPEIERAGQMILKQPFGVPMAVWV